MLFLQEPSKLNSDSSLMFCSETYFRSIWKFWRPNKNLSLSLEEEVTFRGQKDRPLDCLEVLFWQWMKTSHRPKRPHQDPRDHPAPPFSYITTPWILVALYIDCYVKWLKVTREKVFFYVNCYSSVVMISNGWWGGWRWINWETWGTQLKLLNLKNK